MQRLELFAFFRFEPPKYVLGRFSLARIVALGAGMVSAVACSGGVVTPGDGEGSGGSDAGMTESGGSPGSGGSPNGGSSGGTSSTGGDSMASGGAGDGSGGSVSTGPCAAQAVDPAFSLRWEDNFDSFDSGRWTKMEHTFAENLAQFSADAVVAEGGYLKIFLTAQQTGEKEYRGGEIRTNDEFQYGRFDTCVRWGRGGGVVGSFFTYVFDPWNEIDIEYLGGNPVGIQYNVIWDPGGGNQYDPQFDALGFDPADEFHQYSMEWIPGEIRFYVDGALRHTESQASAQAITRSTTLRMNLWASWTGFAGNFEPGAIPTESWYDWVRVYDYKP